MPAVMYSGKKNLLRCFVFMYGFVLFFCLFACFLNLPWDLNNSVHKL